MSVDSAWLAGVRQRNRVALGMAGMADAGGLGFVSSRGLVDAARAERELRTQSIHAGRFTPTDPTEGSVESIAKALGPAEVPPPPQIPAALGWAVGLFVVGAGGFVLYKLVKG